MRGMRHLQLLGALAFFIMVVWQFTGCGNASEPTGALASQDDGARGNIEPASLQEARQVLDLRKLKNPAKSQAIESQATSAMLLVPMNVGSSWQYYLDKLTGDGWKEVAQAGGRQLTDQYASASFIKQGFQLSMYISQVAGQKNMTNVMLRNHGNIDTRALPIPQGATALYSSPMSTIVVAQTNVTETVAACRKELAAAGWQEFGPAFTALAENAENVSLNFRKRGMDLSAFIGVAPAQGGKTTIQFSTTMLLNELPWPPDASKVEFDPQRIYLACESMQTMDKLAGFYRQELARLGWEWQEKLKDNSDVRTTLYFDDAEKNRLMVILNKADEATSVKIDHYSAELLAEMELPHDGNRRKPRREKMPEVAARSDDSNLIHARGLPIPVGSRDLDYDADANHITFKSDLSLAALSEHFREKLDAKVWTEAKDSATTEEMIATLQFVHGDTRLFILLFDLGMGGSTEVTITGYGLAWGDAEQTLGNDQPAVEEDDQGNREDQRR